MTYKSIHFPDREFETKEELFKELKENISIIEDQKKGKIYESYKKGQSINMKPIDISKFDIEQQKALKLDDSFYYIAFNSTRILDSHEDVHIDGLWKKTIQEKQFKNYVVTDHELEVLNTVVRKEYVEIFTAKVPFSILGKSYNGNTEVLIYKFPKDKVQIPIVKEWLDSGDELQGSVRMKYIKFLFCLDSNNPEDEEFKKNYDKYLEYIANKDEFEYIPYFFAILEASNEKESSFVLYGSNQVTGQITDNKQSEKSLKKINIKMEQNTDIMFIDEMIPHHEMAIEMSKKAKPDIKNKELKNIVSNIIKNQKEEIEEMKKIKKDIEAVNDTSKTKEEPSKDTQIIKRKLSVI